MKSPIVVQIFFIVLLLFGSSFYVFHDIEVIYKINGVDHNLSDGITKLEFNELVVTTNRDIKIEAFTVTLTRGNKAVKTIDITGNEFDLRRFTSVVRPGDYVVIEVKKFNEKRNNNSVFIKSIKVI